MGLEGFGKITGSDRTAFYAAAVLCGIFDLLCFNLLFCWQMRERGFGWKVVEAFGSMIDGDVTEDGRCMARELGGLKARVLGGRGGRWRLDCGGSVG